MPISMCRFVIDLQVQKKQEKWQLDLMMTWTRLKKRVRQKKKQREEQKIPQESRHQ